MKAFFRIILIYLLAVSVSSCLTMLAIASSSRAKAQVQGAEFGEDKATMELRTFQRISQYAALAYTGNGDVVCVIDDFGDYYDGMKVFDMFIKEGTYSYLTASGANKTVLVYSRKKNRKALESYIRGFLKEKPAVVVDNPSVMSV